MVSSCLFSFLNRCLASISSGASRRRRGRGRRPSHRAPARPGLGGIGEGRSSSPIAARGLDVPRGLEVPWGPCVEVDLYPPSGLALGSQIGFDDGFVRFVGDAVVAEVVPAGGAAALVGVGPVAPFVQVGLIHLQIAVAIAGAGDIAGQQGGQLVAQALVDGLLLGGQAVARQQVLVGAVELELRRVDALVYLIELFGIDQAVGGAVQAADAYQFVVFVAQGALVLGEQHGGGLALALQVVVDGTAGAEAVGVYIAAGAVPDTALVLTYALLREYLHAGVGGGDDAGGGADGADVGALFGEVAAADGRLLRFGEVGHDRLGVQLHCVG